MTALLLAFLLAAEAPPPATTPEAAAPVSKVDGLAPLAGNARVLATGVPEIPPAFTARIQQYQNARAAGLRDVAEDGSAVLVGTRFGRTTQLHLVERPLGMRRQLTFLEEPISGGAFEAGRPGVVWYLQDVGGGEFYQVYRLDRRAGRAELVTDGKSRHESLVLSQDGRRAAWNGTGRNGKDGDVYVAESARPKEARRVVEAEGAWFPLDFSPDGERLLVMQFRAASDADLHVVDLRSGERRLLSSKQGPASIGGAAFSRDGKAVWFVTDRYGDFNELVRLDLTRPESKPVSYTRDVRWDVEGFTVARDADRVAFSVNADGTSQLRLLDPASRRITPVETPPGMVTALAFPAKRSTSLFFAVNGPRSPNDVWRLDLRTKQVERWTESEVGGLDASRFALPQLVRYPSTDGVQVPAFLYSPPADRFPGPRPVVVHWHGGPEGQHRPAFSPFLQFVVNELGFAWLEPNVRGSEGYGKAYLAMDDGVKREASLADIDATLDFIASRPALDATRVAVYGGSYGGYMTLASLAFHGDRIRAGVSVVGISSLPSFLQNTQAYRRDLRRAEYGDERIPEVRAVQERISPLLHVDRIQPQALMVAQGKNDPRVPQSESEQIVNAVKAKGSQVAYVLALDEGHGFAKKENRDLVNAAVAAFLERALGAK